jgi:hypothetical protein
MKAIETTLLVNLDGSATLQVPPEIPPGQHHAVLVIDEPGPGQLEKTDIPTISVGAWPADLSLRREDFYGDDER